MAVDGPNTKLEGDEIDHLDYNPKEVRICTKSGECLTLRAEIAIGKGGVIPRLHVTYGTWARKEEKKP